MKAKKIISESVIKNIISESIMKFMLNELSTKINFGANGPIPLLPVTNLAKDIPAPVIQKIRAQGEDAVVECAEELEGTMIKRIYDQYKNSFSKRRSGQERSLAYFVNMVVTNKWHGLRLFYYENEGSYMFGTKKGGVFLCSHLAPKDTVMGLAKLIINMGGFNNVVFAITEDLAPMFEKIGMPKFSSKVQCHFRNMDVTKDVYATTLEAAAIGAKILGFTNLDFGSIMANGLSEKDMQLIDENPDLALELLQDVNLNDLIKYMPSNFIQMMTDVVSNFAQRGIEG